MSGEEKNIYRPDDKLIRLDDILIRPLFNVDFYMVDTGKRILRFIPCIGELGLNFHLTMLHFYIVRQLNILKRTD